MELNIVMTTRPSTLPTAAWPLTVSLPIAAAPVAVLGAERAPVSREHQVQIQAELGKAVLMLVNGNKGTTGFAASSKRYADGGSGVPPRGRPV
ncbi:hypothetical protein [Actinoplanes couchii]|uniref:Uncharacterized protein n=1 Tax=Actinoplanes couchii TaxID=403638 RepID=A0ABQ3X694_9ACTN|nr:hypothetical protein [Actinoplanes couchii]MDR6325259.1 hypothetical protein [Actinoplanes couchii]GID54037.1 hypothetical protein Aco03nite_024410 [Actinoplanes couchii]